jgi:hypothetical protein
METTMPPDGIILVFNADSGITAMLLDVVKKAVGREDCALCEITYSPLGKRSAWRACEQRLRLTIDELHRDQLPAEWKLSPADLPCVLARAGDERPVILVSRDEIAACGGSIDRLETHIREALARVTGRAA